MPTYQVNFSNNTDRTWTMAVYQTLPLSPGLSSVSWKQTRAAVGGYTGVSWDLSYTVNLLNYTQQGGKGVYTASQTLGANLGEAWEVVFSEGLQQLRRVGPARSPEQIVITNNSNEVANPGIGMSGAPSVFKYNVPGTGNALFEVRPTYWVGLFNDVVLGEVISSNVNVGPLMVKFPSGKTSASLDASMDGANVVLKLTYSGGTVGGSLSMNLAEIDARTAEFTAAAQIPAGDQEPSAVLRAPRHRQNS